MRIVFMGTPDFAGPCLKRLAEDGHELLAVYTQPDKPQGRKFGDKTVKAVRAFQKKQGYAEDGILGALTWLALLGVI